MKTILISMLLVSGIFRADALVISEIMYDPEGTNSGRYWIEVFNDTDTAINLTTWKFLEAGVNHGITAYQGGSTLPANSYAVIADNPTKFKEDNDYSGILYDSSFSLSTSGESLSLKETTSSSPVYTIDYTPYISLGGDNDGSTLSFVSSAWVRGKATPGAENIPEEKPALAATDISTENQKTIPQMSPPSPDIILYMPQEMLAVAGAETKLKVSGITRAGKEIEDLRFTWAFGDGGQGTGSTTKHAYVYSGRYVAQVHGSNSYIAGNGRMVVRVVSPDISIAEIGQGKYGAYVDMVNPNAYDLDVSGWIISINGAPYPFPENTIVAGNTRTRFAGSSMGFASTSMATSTIVKILFPNLEEVARYIPIPVLAPAVSQLATVTATATTKLAVRPQPKVLGVSTSTKVQPTSTPPIRATSKDRRIVHWFRSLFGR